MIRICGAAARTWRATRWVKSGLSMMTSTSGLAAITAAAVSRMRRRIIGSLAITAAKPTIARSSIGNSACKPSRRHGATADAGKRHRLSERCLQRAHQRGAEPIAGFLAATMKRSRGAASQRPLAAAVGHGRGRTPTTNTFGVVGGFATRCGSATIVPPATTAMPASPARAAPSTVAGRSPADRSGGPARLRRLDQHADAGGQCGCGRRGAAPRPASSMRSVPSAASTASTLPSATTAACPTSNGPIAASSARPRAMSARSRARGRASAERALGDQDFRRHLMRAKQAKAVVLEHAPMPDSR